jgi:DNA-binding response OmpR family regulator
LKRVEFSIRCGANGAQLNAVSGHGQEEDRRKGRDAGFDHHLTRLRSCAELERALQRRRSWNPLRPDV